MPQYYSLTQSDDSKQELLDDFAAYAARHGSSDYRVEASSYGGAELKGIRKSQEDRMLGYLLIEDNVTDALCSLTPNVQQALIKASFQTMQEKLKTELSDEIRYQGSTAMVALIMPAQNRVLSASLGDSQIFAAKLAPDNTLISVRELNTTHVPDSPQERLRIEKAAKEKGKSYHHYVKNERLGGTLAVSAAFGDLAYDQFGIRRVPELRDETFDLEDGEKLWIITACDGLTEKNLISYEEIGCIVAKNHEQTPGTIAATLAQAAIDAGSTDNVSVQVTCITQNKSASMQHPLLLCVFDGHGGCLVSETLQKHFINVFLSKLSELVPDSGIVIEDVQDSAPGTPVFPSSPQPSLTPSPTNAVLSQSQEHTNTQDFTSELVEKLQALKKEQENSQSSTSNKKTSCCEIMAVAASTLCSFSNEHANVNGANAKKEDQQKKTYQLRDRSRLRIPRY